MRRASFVWSKMRATDRKSEQKLDAETGQTGSGEPFVVPASVFIHGSIVVQGDLVIEGTIDGGAEAQRIVLTATGQLSGVVLATDITVAGIADEVSIYADEIRLSSGCSVTGELYHAKLDIEPDSYFEGKSRRYPDPRSMAPRDR